jgi:hypothetical protein
MEAYTRRVRYNFGNIKDESVQLYDSISTTTSTATTLFSGTEALGNLHALKNPSFKKTMDKIKSLTPLEKRDEVTKKLTKLSKRLAERFFGAWQVLTDTSKKDRFSQAAGSMKEVLSWFEHVLAPDEDVKKAVWYIQDPTAKGPTQRQRIKYDIVGDTAKGIDQKDIQQIEELMNNARTTYEDLNSIYHDRSERDEEPEKDKELLIVTRSYMEQVQEIVLLVLKLREGVFYR